MGGLQFRFRAFLAATGQTEEQASNLDFILWNRDQWSEYDTGGYGLPDAIPGIRRVEDQHHFNAWLAERVGLSLEAPL